MQFLRRLAQPDPLDSYRMLRRLQIILGSGFAVVFFYAFRYLHSWETFATVVTVGLIGAGASLVAGFLMGFIFGIPRTSTHRNSSTAQASVTPTGPPDSSAVEPNTNLVEISDWLTKILVGVSLVELGKIPGKVRALASYLANGLRDCSRESAPSLSCVLSSESLGMGIIVFFAVCGFLIGYLWARLYLQRAFGELGHIKEQVGETRAWNYILLARLLTGLGTWMPPSHFDSDRLKEAIRTIEKGLAKYPSDADLHLEKAYLLKRTAMLEQPPNRALIGEALANCQEALTQRPDDAEAIYNAACYQALLGQAAEEVLAKLDRAFRLKPELRAYAATDTDLDSVRARPEFQSLFNPGTAPHQ